MEQKKKILSVAGPTASGKTALAISLARRLDGEVISNDSMQIYTGMSIGTAAPTESEMENIPHHMIAAVPPTTDFSCADFAEMTAPIVEDILARDRLPVFCGGTGLYLDAVLYGDGLSDSTKNPAVRACFEAVAREQGADALHGLLAAVDPESAAAIHPNNVRRVIRALEIYETTGIPKSQFDGLSPTADAKYDCVRIVLSFQSRQLLYERIDKRVAEMMQAGLLEEVTGLYEAGLLREDAPAFQAIGYKEFLPYFAGECTLEQTVDEICRNTRRYAKRQITWFKRYTEAIVVSVDAHGQMRPTEQLAEEVCKKLHNQHFFGNG